MGRIYEALKRAEAEQQSLRKREELPTFPGTVGLQAEASEFRSPAGLPTAAAVESGPESIGTELDLLPIPDSRLCSQRIDGTLEVDQLRLLHAKLLELQSQQPFKRLLITSASNGEGKTHVAASLAWTLASEGDRKVLLIDADTHNPSLHLVCGIANSYGLKDLLLNDGDPWKALRKFKKTGLYVLTGGTAVCESINSSNLARFRNLLETCGPAFDLIILDSPPLLGVVDTKLVSGLVDALLVVVHAGTTSRALVSKAQEQLEGQHVLGVVLNGLDPHSSCFADYKSRPESPVKGTVDNSSVRSAAL